MNSFKASLKRQHSRATVFLSCSTEALRGSFDPPIIPRRYAPIFVFVFFMGKLWWWSGGTAECREGIAVVVQASLAQHGGPAQADALAGFNSGPGGRPATSRCAGADRTEAL